MPTSDADLDQQLRAAMKTLDDEVPSGYFEALPDLTLARLEGSTMQHGTQGTTENASAAPPPAATNTEDSGLHDIRNLAQSTKQRLSSKRITTSPPVSEDDLIASSSAGWKAVALPQPAKMVALPELSELPSKKEVLAKEKAAAKAEKVAAKVAAVEAAAPVEAAPAAAARQPAFSLPSAQPKKSKKGVIAIVGIGLAAAAGAAIFVTTQKKDAASKEAPALAQNTAVTAVPIAAPTGGAGAGSAAVSGDVQKAEDEVAKAQAEADKMKAELAAAQAAAPAPEAKADVPKTPTKTTKGHGKEKVETTPTPKPDETKTVTPDKGKDTKKADTTKPAGSDAEPDFNDLLKEAGVKDPEKKKPVLDKKELTGDDFKKGMAAVTTKAAGCYKGTQGTATVKMTIAPSGQIAKVSVSGPFATTPEGACVVNAVKGASFPPWDGHPASFTYPILLSE